MSTDVSRAAEAAFAPFAFPVLRDTDFTEVAERARVQGHAAGYAAGRREATATLEAELAALRAEQERELADERAHLAAAAALLRQASAAWDQHVATAAIAAEDALLAAAVEVATAILGRELQDREGSALAAARRALEAAAEMPVQTLRMHPADVELVLAAGGGGGVTLVPDATVARGDAMADLPDGVVDARIATATERVRRALLGADA